MKASNFNQSIVVEFTNAESLVLLDWLARFNANMPMSFFEDPAEARVLFDLEVVLEQNMSDTFKDDYREILNQARNLIRDRE